MMYVAGAVKSTTAHETTEVTSQALATELYAIYFNCVYITIQQTEIKSNAVLCPMNGFE